MLTFRTFLTDGSDQAVKVADDIFTPLTYIDDELKLNELPVYVPSTRLYEFVDEDGWQYY